jgi:hypothetical protein
VVPLLVGGAGQPVAGSSTSNTLRCRASGITAPSSRSQSERPGMEPRMVHKQRLAWVRVSRDPSSRNPAAALRRYKRQEPTCQAVQVDVKGRIN